MRGACKNSRQALPDRLLPNDPQREQRAVNVVSAARGWLGTPYHDQASVRGVGCDCLGLVRGVWRDLHGPEPMPIPPYSRDWGETGAARAAWPKPPGG